MTAPRTLVNHLPKPLAVGLRWCWRRLPPRDRRFLLQNLETPERRHDFLRSSAYSEFVEMESQYWSMHESATGNSDCADGAMTGRACYVHPFEHPRIRRALDTRAGLGEKGLWEWIKDILPSGGHALVPGAGNGNHCRMLIDSGVARTVLAYDIAVNMVRRVGRELVQLGYPIDYRVADINFQPLDHRAYDLCLALKALHHCIDIETIFERIALALKRPHGRLVMEEYVGPRYLEFPRALRVLCDSWLQRLPPRLKLDATTKIPLLHVPFADRWWVQRRTPFESIRSDRIVPAIRAAMEFEIERPLGGGLLMPLLSPIIDCFDPGDNEANEWLDRLLDDDARATRCGEIPNCYLFAVARPRG